VPKIKSTRSPVPTTEEIARRAYEIFVARGGKNGHELDDWLQAEAELLNERGQAPASRSNGSES
jgi:hypothetical protein